jgi:hypothetical protein
MFCKVPGGLTWFENGPTIVCLEGSWGSRRFLGGLGWILAGLGEVLGGFLGILGESWGAWGEVLGVLRGSWEGPGKALLCKPGTYDEYSFSLDNSLFLLVSEAETAHYRATMRPR